MEREYDVIVYGANGFAGTFVTKELKKTNFKIALAARNIKKIKDKTLPLFNCEIEQLDHILKKTKILLNCTGPYEIIGEKIVEKCINAKTHYVDITREYGFFESIYRKYDEKAKKMGVFVIIGSGTNPIFPGFSILLLRKMYDSAIVNLITAVDKLYGEKTNITSWLLNEIYFKEKMNRKERKPLIDEFLSSKVLKSYTYYNATHDKAFIESTLDLMYRAGLNDNFSVNVYFSFTPFYRAFAVFMVRLIPLFLLKKKFVQKILISIFNFLTNNIKSEEELRKNKGTVLIHAIGVKKNKNFRKTIIIESFEDSQYIIMPIICTELLKIFIGSLKKKIENKWMSLYSGGVITSLCLLLDTDIKERLVKKGIKFIIEDTK